MKTVKKLILFEDYFTKFTARTVSYSEVIPSAFSSLKLHPDKLNYLQQNL